MARKTRMQPAGQAEVLEEVETGGIGIDEGIVLATFLLLIGALVLVIVANQGYPA
jgi:hypothetical protein